MGKNRLGKAFVHLRFPLVSFAAFLVLLGVGELADLAGFGHSALFIWTLSILPFAASLYRVRRRNRLIYGAFELLIAVFFFYFLLVGMTSVAKPMTVELVANRMLTMFAAIYFIVRGFDSIGEGLKQFGCHTNWDTFFFGSVQEGENARSRIR
jgi:hypothetical protein